jgi:integrase
MVDVRVRRADGTKARDRKIVEGPQTAARGWGERRQAVMLGELHGSGWRGPEGSPSSGAAVLTVSEWSTTFLTRHYMGSKASASDAARSIIETHVVPHVGALPLSRLTTSAVDELEATWRAGGYKEKNRDRLIRPCASTKTINNRRMVVLSLLKYAIACSDETGLTAMPCTIKLAKVDTQKAPAHYSVEEYLSIIGAAKSIDDRRHLAIVLLGGDAGLRRGEMLSLRWRDVNYKTGKITVRESVYQRTITDRVASETKGGLERPVRMTARLGAALKAMPKGEPDGYVLPGDAEQAITQKTLQVMMQRIERAAGLPQTGRVHVLRHTFCSHLAMAGVPVRTIMDMARHANLTTTLRYMHLAKDAQDSAVVALERLRRAG